MKRGGRVRRGEVMLLPECLDDYVGPDNPVRALDVYIEKLDLGALGFEIKAPHTVGSPITFERAALLKLLVYGYLNQIRSSRKLEKETRRNLEVIWLTEKARPDYWTINECRKVNFKAFKAVMREFHKVCLRLGLFGRELEAIDGSFFRAQNSKSNNWTESKLDAMEKKIEAAIEAYGQALEDSEEKDGEGDGKGEHDRGEQGEERAGGEQAQAEAEGGGEEVAPKNLRAEGTLEELQAKKRRIGQLRQEAAKSPSGQLSRNDPDSRMLSKGNGSMVGHNVQSVVDGKHHLVAHMQIVQAGNDLHQLEAMARAGCEAIRIEPGADDPIDIVADGGYYNGEEMAKCEQAGMRVHVPAPKTRAVDQPGYRVEDFRYEEQSDEYVCPAGCRLTRHSDSVQRQTVYRLYYNTAACSKCIHRPQCTKAKYRRLKISAHREIEQKVARRIEQQPEIYARRKELVEHPFGTIKSSWGYSQFTLTGAAKCDGELNLMAFCYNWKRVLALVGMEKLMEVIQDATSALKRLLRRASHKAHGSTADAIRVFRAEFPAFSRKKAA